MRSVEVPPRKYGRTVTAVGTSVVDFQTRGFRGSLSLVVGVRANRAAPWWVGWGSRLGCRVLQMHQRVLRPAPARRPVPVPRRPTVQRLPPAPPRVLAQVCGPKGSLPEW